MEMKKVRDFALLLIFLRVANLDNALNPILRKLQRYLRLLN